MNCARSTLRPVAGRYAGLRAVVAPVALGVALSVACSPEPTSPGAGLAGAPASPPPAYASHLERAEVLQRQGQTGQARQEARTALELAPWARPAYEVLSRHFGRDTRAPEFFDELARRYPGLAHPPSFRGHHQALLGRWDEAEASLLRTLELDPDYPDAHFRLGLVRSSRGDFVAAAASFGEAHAQEPSERRAVMWIRALRVAGDYAAAARAVTQVLESHPDSGELHALHAQALIRDGDAAGAESALRRAIRIDPSLDRAHRELAALLQRDGRIQEARTHLIQAERLHDFNEMSVALEDRLRAGSPDPHLALLRAELAMTVGRIDEALRWLERGERMGGSAARVAAGKAWCRLAQDDVQAAEAILRATGADEDVYVMLSRAALAARRGDSRVARRWLDRAAAAAPDERSFLRRASDLYAALGNEHRSAELRHRATTAPLL